MRCSLRSLAASTALLVALAGCSSDGSEGSSGTTAAGGATTASTAAPATTGTTAPVVVEDGDLRVAIVADSEIPPEVAALVDEAPGIAVVSSELHDGFRMAQLDPFAEEALAQEPDVLVYSGSTNDLDAGPAALLDGLDQRLRSYVASTCTVMAVPVFRYEAGTPEEVETRTEGTRILERASADTGAHVASYLDVSIALAADGTDFFAEGELGALHPSAAAHPGIAAAIVREVEDCRTTT